MSGIGFSLNSVATGTFLVNSKIEKNKTLIDVFKGYLDTALMANIWFYALTGGAVTYYLSNREGKPYLRFSLFLPFLLGCLIIVLSARAIRLARSLKEKILEEAGYSKTEKSPSLEFFVSFLWASIALISVVCAGLLCLFNWWPRFVFGA